MKESKCISGCGKKHSERKIITFEHNGFNFKTTKVRLQCEECAKKYLMSVFDSFCEKFLKEKKHAKK